MKNKLLSFFVSLLLTGLLYSQDKEFEPVGINSVNEAAVMANQIVKAAGLKANFKIAEAEVPNAMAVVHEGKRFILYNPQFISLLTRATGTKWAAVSVLAHEIGHHLYSSAVNKGKTPLVTETEADLFSGFVLQKMGATLQEAQAAMKVLGSRYATRTHPGRDDRMDAIATGWKDAGGVLTEVENDPEMTSTAVADPDREQLLGIPNSNIVAAIEFNADPGTEYYITTKLNLVKFESSRVQMIGKLTKSNDQRYPFIIYDESGFRLYVNTRGEIFSRRGISVGRMKKLG